MKTKSLKGRIILTIVIFMILIICINNYCYADIIFTPDIADVGVIALTPFIYGIINPSVLRAYILIPLVILYIICFIMIIKRNAKSKGKAFLKCILLFIPMLMILSSIGLVNDNLIANLDEYKKYGFIDKNKNKVIDYKYENTSGFSNGLAAVKLDGKWGYIDKNESIIINFKYDYAGLFDGKYMQVGQFEREYLRLWSWWTNGISFIWNNRC